MGMLSALGKIILPQPPKEYDVAYTRQLLQKLETFFERQNAVQHVNMASLNIDTTTLPTEADLADLRVGDVYRDSTASNVLKVKT